MGLLGCPARCPARPPTRGPRGHGAVQEEERKDLLGRSVVTGRKGRTEVKGLFSQRRDITRGEPLSVSRNDLKKGRDSKVTMFATSTVLVRAEQTRAGCEELPGPSHQAAGR